MDELDKAIEELEGKLNGKLAPAFDQVAQRMVRLGQLTQADANLKLQEINNLQRSIQVQKRVDDTLQVFGGTLSTAAKGLAEMAKAGLDAGFAMSNTGQAFTSATGSLSTMNTLLQGVITSFGEAGSGISIFGFSTGRIALGAAKIVNTALSFTETIVNKQLQLAQQVTNRFAALGAAGVTFGGSLGAMTRAAAESGQTMQLFTEFTTQNIETLSTFGGNLANSAATLLKFGRQLGQNNAGLLASYGSQEELNKGIAQYVGLQLQLGFDQRRITQNLEQGATSYLIRQRELTALTGKRADQLAEEEKQRRRELDYNIRMSQLGADQQKNVEAVVQSMYLISKEAGDYAKEYFATEGNVVSQQALRFQALNKEVADLAQAGLGVTGQTAAGFNQAFGQILQTSAPQLEQWAKDQVQLASINRAAMNETLTMITTTASGVIANLSKLKNATDFFETLQFDRQGDADAKIAANAINQIIVNQRELDKAATESMRRIEGLLDFTFQMQRRMIEVGNRTADLVSLMTSKQTISLEALEAAARRLLGMTPSESAASGTASGTVQNPQGFPTAPSTSNQSVSRIDPSQYQTQLALLEDMNRTLRQISQNTA